MSLARARWLAAAVVVSMVVALTSVLAVGSPALAAETPVLVPSDGESVPGTHSGDSIDDPAIWVDHEAPAQSLVIANDKLGALETYDLDGALVQRIAPDSGSWGNVDIRQDVTIGAYSGDLVAVPHQGMRFYSVDHGTRQLAPINDSVLTQGLGEGLCLYRSRNIVYGISITIQGVLTQYEILDSDNDGLLETHTVRSFSIGSEAEGCVADDATGALYVSEEDHALWRYSAEPGDGTNREAVDVVAADGGHLVDDIEGVTLVDQGNGAGYIIASAQNVADPNNSYFSVYRRGAGNDFVNTFRVANGSGSDDCDRTDGVAAVTADLGPAFPRGLFVCQDNNNDLPGTAGNEDVKLVRLEKVVDLGGGPPPPPPPPPPPSAISFVGRSTANSNSTSWTVPVPTGTQAGDQLLLFASYGNTMSPGGPGPGWTPVGSKVVDNSVATSVWRRTAVAGDLGTSVRLTNGSVTKLSLTLASYRGVDPAGPVLAANFAGEPGNTAAHTTPLVANSTTGAWRVSFWTDKNAATTHWTAPTGETTRATTAGTGSGRIATLLTDPAAAQTAGAPTSTGGLTATADATASAATMWTLLLKPAADSPPVNEPPVARFTFHCSDLTCDFEGSDSSDAEEGISSYAWDFDDTHTGDQVSEHHVFEAAGTYDVTLTVKDDVGASDSVTHPVTVGDAPPPSTISFVGQASSNVNSRTVSVRVPASVQADDALLLFAAQGKGQALTGPGPGWTPAGNVVDGDVSTTVWQRVATAGDANSTVQLTTGTISKIALTVAAYHGTSTTDPVLAISGVAEPGTSRSHVTPTVANDTSGAWRVSYWSDKNAATTSWQPPAGEVVRGTTYGTGSGRVDALLTDSNAALTAGSPATTGGLTATADGSADKATSWTILLRPGP